MSRDDPQPRTGLSAQIHEIVNRGDALFSRGDFPQALLHFTTAAKHFPNVPEYSYRVGLANWRMGHQEAALQHLQRAIQLKSDFPHAHGELGRVFLAMGQIEPALIHTRRAVELEPGAPTLSIALASVLEANRQPDAAGEIIDRLLKTGHETTDLAMVYARLAPRLNHQTQALSLIDRLLAKTPPITISEQSALHFSAANLLDALGRYDEAFAHASAANALRAAPYDPAQTEHAFENFMHYFTRAKLARFPRPSAPVDLPVFIVGMPRSGTSLIEQILASHPAVHGAGELNWIARLFESAVIKGAHGSNPSLESLDELTAGDIEALADEYLTPLRALNPAVRFITDKMPTNFIYLGLIAILFPQAKIIHCRRDALDTCLSCFMTDFAAGYEFSFSLPAVGHFYRQYQRMMSHWKSAIDLPILEVNYEDVVADLEGQSRRMLAFLNLPWDDRCIQFHETNRFAGTASHAQVRRPLYQSSVGRWKNYEKLLALLKKSLAVNKA